jgi:predicted transcriptional regulator
MEEGFSRRERQIMDIVYRQGKVSARDIWGAMPEQPSYGSTRKHLQILVSKGHLKQRPKGRSLLYSAVRTRKRAARTALNRLLDTFYDGSVEEAVSGMLTLKDQKLSADELDRIAHLVEQAKNNTTTSS